jgi:hypothetical protein
LRQFKALLGTLDPVGMPLATATLSGEQADDPQYVPAWERLVATIGRPDFLTVGDCKLASLGNCAHIHRGGGLYLAPRPMTGQTPAELQAWVLDPPAPLEPIRLPDQAESEPPVGQGFEVAVTCTWQNPDTSATVTWTERRLIVQSTAHAERQRAGLQARLVKAHTALTALNARPASAPADLEQRAQAILKRYQVSDFLSLSFREQVTRQSARRAADRPTVRRRPLRRAAGRFAPPLPSGHRTFNRLAGWRVYVAMRPLRLSLGAVSAIGKNGNRNMAPSAQGDYWRYPLRDEPHPRPLGSLTGVDAHRVCCPTRLGRHRRNAQRAICQQS